HILGLFVLPNLAPPKDVPAVVGRDLIEPCRERSRGVVLRQVLLHFDEDVHGGVFGVLPRGQSFAAKPEHGRSVIPVKRPPSLGIPCPGFGDRLQRFRYSRRTHPAWSQRFHGLVRSHPLQNYTLQSAHFRTRPLGHSTSDW